MNNACAAVELSVMCSDPPRELERDRAHRRQLAAVQLGVEPELLAIRRELSVTDGGTITIKYTGTAIRGSLPRIFNDYP